MQTLVCSAQNCIYNNAMYCTRGDIKIGGQHANACQDTCCESFQERRSDCGRNSVGTPKMKAEICCEAENCRYNDKCACHAEHVDISGAAACRCQETECVTFCEK